MPDRIDPYRGYNFRVELANVPDPAAGFRECSGLTLTTDAVDYREGKDIPLTVRKLTGLRKQNNIVLKRGITQARKELWNWYKNTINGVQDRRDGAIVLQDEEHKDVLRWKFENGWICKWEGPSVNATGNDVAIESIEICHEGLLLV
ncbi:MAG: phage tail protein [Verrucomicrobia bacterium]|nr:MAG: phage tail protein [Verrucomicrobiota bacterium]